MITFFLLLDYVFFNLFFSHFLRFWGYLGFIFLFLAFVFLLVSLNKSILWYHFLFSFYSHDAFQVTYMIGIDSFSIYFIILCVFILMYCLVIYWNLKYKINLYIFLLFVSMFIFVNIFSSIDMVYFYVFFEAVVVPMFLLIVFEVVVLGRFMPHIYFLFILY